eukprot:CAMPEP_0184706884 /NCGR_PEP_ID=MMETSP0313-20130426/36984_1 /TAXON_ID=2792 /ORGANISM="Porphyridium aerugineum, Strain SAG 1380-2" /LENGTH=367 /DNA_ID=CAMNT_0027168451 /DNA_START=1256 /DNA_END=2359 /DNA_ORIENTATION=+
MNKIPSTDEVGGDSHDATELRALQFNKTFGAALRIPFSLINFILLNIYVIVQYKLYRQVTAWDWILAYGLGISLIGCVMSVCLHRFFSHRAFQTTRWFSFVLAWVSCLAAQRGPLWWASKHIKHHATCDTAEDPHSPIQSGILYSVFFSAFDSEVDWKYVPRRLLSTELLILDTFHFVPPITALALLYWWTDSLATTVFLGSLPMTHCCLMTNIFNARFHDDHDSEMETKCRAVNRETELMATLVGENLHMEHHLFPRLAQRHRFDLPYWLVIRPLLFLGLVWDAQYVGVEEYDRRKMAKLNPPFSEEKSVKEIVDVNSKDMNKESSFSFVDMYLWTGLKGSLIESVIVGYCLKSLVMYGYSLVAKS